MNSDPSENSGYGPPETVSGGAFDGWMTWGRGADPYETLVGPFFFKIENGAARCAFEPRREHLNGGGAIHGGLLMSFADFSLFSIAHNALAGEHAVTLTCNCEFASAGRLGHVMEARGDVVRAARSVIFVRGLITQNTQTVLAFSGALKKIRKEVR